LCNRFIQVTQQTKPGIYMRKASIFSILQKPKHWALGACMISVAALVGCGGNDDVAVIGTGTPTLTITNTVTGTVTASVNGAVQGRVLNAATGVPIAGAQVKAGASTATSGADGSYVLANVAPNARVAIVAEATDFSEGLALTPTAANTTSTLDIRLLKAGVTASIVQAAGGTVVVPNSLAQIVLPANFAVRADGTTPTGPVTVKVTPIAPANDSAFMPGDYTTLVGGAPAPLESFGAVAVSLSDSTGPLAMGAGKSATLRIPVSTRAAAGDVPGTIPLFYLDRVTGRWVQDGTATLQVSGANRFFEGVVTRAGTWNADRVMETVTVNGCVNNAAGAVASGVRISSDGIDYVGISSAVSDASGKFSIAIKKSGKAIVSGAGANAITAGPYTSTFSITQCLTQAVAGSGVSVKLTWGVSPRDLDSYMTLPNGEVTYYGSPDKTETNLDVDDTDSFGPEVITVTRLMVGTYKYGVRNYVGTNNPNTTGSPAKVELTIGSSVSIYAPPAGEPIGSETTDGNNSVWNVFNLVVADNCAITVVPVNAWTVAEPTQGTTTAPRYCVRP
jgi:hypothetical protein